MGTIMHWLYEHHWHQINRTGPIDIKTFLKNSWAGLLMLLAEVTVISWIVYLFFRYMD